MPADFKSASSCVQSNLVGSNPTTRANIRFKVTNMSKTKSYLLNSKVLPIYETSKSISANYGAKQHIGEQNVVYTQEDEELEALKRFVYKYNYKDYPNNYPYFIKADYTKGQYNLVLQIGITIDVEEPQNSDTTDYSFLNILTVVGKDANTTINAFKSICLDIDLKEYIINFYK